MHVSKSSCWGLEQKHRRTTKATSVPSANTRSIATSERARAPASNASPCSGCSHSATTSLDKEDEGSQVDSEPAPREGDTHRREDHDALHELSRSFLPDIPLDLSEELRAWWMAQFEEQEALWKRASGGGARQEATTRMFHVQHVSHGQTMAQQVSGARYCPPAERPCP